MGAPSGGSVYELHGVCALSLFISGFNKTHKKFMGKELHGAFEGQLQEREGTCGVACLLIQQSLSDARGSLSTCLQS
jgi:hypothetical protein